MALQFRVGNLAFQIDREISHAKFGVLREFLTHQQYTLYPLNPGGSPKFPTAKFTTANLTWRKIPPPPCILFRPLEGVPYAVCVRCVYWVDS